MQFIPVTKLMSDEVISVAFDTTFAKMQEMMRDYIVNHLPVLDSENKLCGIVSRNDLIREYIRHLKDNPNVDTIPKLTAKDIMVSKVISIKDTADIKQAAEIMLNHEFHSVPVVNAQHQVVGIVTSTDLIEDLVKAY